MTRTGIRPIPGEQHELGTLALAALAREQGLPMIYLGADTPFEALAEVIARMGVRILCLSATLPTSAARLAEAMDGLAEITPSATIAYGGPGFRGVEGTRDHPAWKARYLGGELAEAVDNLQLWWTALELEKAAQLPSPKSGASRQRRKAPGRGAEEESRTPMSAMLASPSS
jgi:hypothetical protein